jgi:hypothetical protein
MKKILLLLIAVFPLLTIPSLAQHRIRIVELHGESFGNLKVKYNGNNTGVNQLGLGASVTVGKERFGAILEYNYRKLDVKNLNVPGLSDLSNSEFFLGARYYPMRPTIMIGNMAIRVTAGAEYGFDMEPEWKMLIFSGVAFSPVTSCSGVSVNFVYRPGEHPVGGYLTEPSYAIRLAFIIGPSLK